MDDRRQSLGIFSSSESLNVLTDGQKMRQMREGQSIEIRAQQRDQQLKKLRFRQPNEEQPLSGNVGTVGSGTAGTQDAKAPVSLLQQLNADLKNFIDQVLKKTFTLSDFPELHQSICGDDILKQHYGVIGLRKILSVEDGPPIQTVIDANLVPRLLELIKQDAHAHLQLEAAWALTNIASGTSHQTQTIIDKGGIPLFVKLLSSKHHEIAEQAIWALGNIAGDCSIYRDMILKCKGLDPLIKIVQTSENKNTIKHGTWAISNLCRGRPLPSFDQVKGAIPALANVLKTSNESEVLTDAAWAMSYLSDGDETRIQLVIDTDVIPALIKQLEHPYLSVVIPSLRTLGNIVTGSDQQTNKVLSYLHALPTIFSLLNHEKRSVRREACWTLSNITAGNEEQIHKVIEKAEHVQKLMQIMETDVAEIKREAAWVLSNATSQGSVPDVQALVQLGVLKSFVELLDESDVKTLPVVLEAINNILKKGKELINAMDETTENPFKIMLEGYGGVSKIEELQCHQSEDVYKKALKILENHFELEEAL